MKVRAGPGRRAWLKARVAIDAFCLNPAAYLQALGWRLRGLKLRARSRVAPLAGRSPHAYQLWIAQQREVTGLGCCEKQVENLLPVIDCRFGASVEAIRASLASVGGALEPVLLGGPRLSGVHQVDQPYQLRALIPASGAWICAIKAGDILASTAVGAYSASIRANPGSTIFYSDDDLIELDGGPHTPHFKPQWNPDLFINHDYVSGACVIWAEPDAIPDGALWAEALLKEALAGGSIPVHIPAVLHSRRSRPKPAVLPQKVEKNFKGPKVTAIIPTRNHEPLLRKCVEGVEQVDYPDVEVIIVDNGSDDPATLEYLGQLEVKGIHVLRRPGPFNYSALNNEAVAQATGTMLCFLNNDVEMIDQDWLTLLVRQAMRPEIGAVGAMLLYPDRTIQHAGVYLGIGGGAGHAHRYLQADEEGYFDRARLPQLVSAVTAACMVVDAAKFRSVGGFDETLFPVAFNDVDLCLKLNSQGWQSFYEPRATLIHHESKSRGSDREKGNRDRFAGELAALKAKWATDRGCDPFHHPQLSPYSEQFVVALF